MISDLFLIDRLGPDIFSKLRMKEHVLHRAQAHLKVPVRSQVAQARYTSSSLYVELCIAT